MWPWVEGHVVIQHPARRDGHRPATPSAYQVWVADDDRIFERIRVRGAEHAALHNIGQVLVVRDAVEQDAGGDGAGH